MGVPILVYHDLDDPSAISIPPAVFAWQMRWLHERGYQVVSLRSLVQGLRSGAPLPTRSIILTFDDGFASVYRLAMPVLAQYGFPATVFLVADYCGRRSDWPGQPSAISPRPLLTWAQISAMRRNGIEFGAHTMTHPRLDRLPAEDMEREILDSRLYIQDRVGHTVDLFAYPYGRYTLAIKAVVGRAYTGACTTRLGTVDGRSDPLALQRIDISYLARPQLFQVLSTPALSFYLGLRRPLRTLASAAFGRPWV